MGESHKTHQWGSAHRRPAFTIIEVVLFIGISGFLIIGLIVGTSATIARQRYNDSVQDFTEYFRREYSAVINPENTHTEKGSISSSICESESATGTTTIVDPEAPNRGRSGCLLYGRLIVVGETDQNIIWSYDVIGRELGSNISEQERSAAAKDIRSALRTAQITVLARDDSGGPAACTYQPIGSYRYTPQWLATVEKTGAPDVPAETSILIVRSPINGSVHTLVLDEALSVQSSAGDDCSSSSSTALLIDKIANPVPTDPEFQLAEVDFCVGSEDVFASGGVRRNVRLTRDGHNSSAVELIEQDDIYDEVTNPGGNRCAL